MAAKSEQSGSFMLAAFTIFTVELVSACADQPIESRESLRNVPQVKAEGTPLIRAVPVPDSMASASFTAPEDCNAPPSNLQIESFKQLCVKRFSSTHERIIFVRQLFWRPTEDGSKISPHAVQEAVYAHQAELIYDNNIRGGGTLEVVSEGWLRKGLWPKGADDCGDSIATLNDAVATSRIGEPVRNVADTTICAAMNIEANAILLVTLTVSERFLEKSEELAPGFVADKMAALQTLKMP